MSENRGGWPLRPLPVHTVLFAAYPILFLFAENTTEVTLRDVIPPLGRAVLAAVAVAMFAAIALRDLRRGALIGSGLIIAWSVYGHVASLAEPMKVPRDVQLAGWGIFLGLVLLAALFLRPGWLSRVTTGLNVIGAVMVIFTMLQIVPYELSAAASTAPGRSTGTPHPGDRDIYYLVFEDYGNETSLKDLYGFQNDLPDWLESQGFYVPRLSHANYVRTSLSIAAVMNLTSLDAVAARMGSQSSNLGPVHDMLQAPEAGRYLQARGYRYIQIGSWFAPTKHSKIADENPQLETATNFEGILDETTFGPTLSDLRNIAAIPLQSSIHRDSALFQARELKRIEAEEPSPKFVYADIIIPHEPYVFNANGDYPSRDQRLHRTVSEAAIQQIQYTNGQIRQIVTDLLSGPEDKRPIVVIQSDEGPAPPRFEADKNHFDWSTATPEELEIKYGILNALYLPGDAPPGAPAPYQTITGWNTFQLIFDRYFGELYPLLPDLSYTSLSYLRPYDLTDITPRLTTLNGGITPPATGPPGTGPPGTGPPALPDPGTSGNGARCDRRGMASQSGC
jgi:hypothetical protein